MSSNTSQQKTSQSHIPHSPTSASSITSAACAACKYQRRRCTPDCILAPHFPASNPRQFLNAHRLFGVSNILKILKNVGPERQQDAIGSIIFQANARAQDPVGGCYRIVIQLQHQIDVLFAELQLLLSQISFYRAQAETAATMASSDDANYAPVAAADYAYENMAAMQQHQQQQYCNYFFSDAQEVQESNHNAITDHDPNINFLDGIGFDMNINALENNMLEMEMIGSGQKSGQEELKPLVDMFHARHAFEDEGESKDLTAESSMTALHCSFKADELKVDQNPREFVREHDLKGAASLFTLKNFNTSVV